MAAHDPVLPSGGRLPRSAGTRPDPNFPSELLDKLCPKLHPEPRNKRRRRPQGTKDERWLWTSIGPENV